MLRKLNTIGNKMYCPHVPPDNPEIAPVIFLPKMYTLSLIRQIQIREFYANKWHGFLKNVKVMKEKNKLKNCHGLEKAKETLTQV